MKFKVTELFYSLQGEGTRNIGCSSVFLRLFGCNFTCSGFGMNKGEKSQERDLIANNISNYSSIDDIPLAKTGCDSFVSWDPRFKKFSSNKTSNEVFEDIKNLVNDVPHESGYKLFNVGKNKDIHLVITGGEPLLAWQKAYPELFDLINSEMDGADWNLTFETNGTQKLHQEFIDYLNNHQNIKVTFSVSPKLSESGEPWEKAINPGAIETYKKVISGYVYGKFVVGREEELEEVERAINDLKHLEDVAIMSVGGCYDEYKELSPTVGKWALSKGYRYTPRLHVDLYGNSWGV